MASASSQGVLWDRKLSINVRKDQMKITEGAMQDQVAVVLGNFCSVVLGNFK